MELATQEVSASTPLIQSNLANKTYRERAKDFFSSPSFNSPDDQERLYTLLTTLISEKKAAKDGEFTCADLCCCCCTIERDQARPLTKDDYRDILEALHDRLPKDFHKALKSAGFRAVSSYSYHSNSKAQEKIEALASWLELVRLNPIVYLTLYMKDLGLGEITGFFSSVTRPTEIGHANDELHLYLTTGNGEPPKYILSDSDGSIGAIILASLKAGHLDLPNTQEAQEVFARVLVRERYAFKRILDFNLNKEKSNEELNPLFDAIDKEQAEALAKISPSQDHAYHGDLNKFKTPIQRAYGTHQADPDQSRDLMTLVQLVTPTQSLFQAPLRFIGDILHDRLTCNDEATIELLQKLPNVIKYEGNHDSALGKFLKRNDCYDSGTYRATPNMEKLKERVKEFTLFTWEGNTVMSHFGLSVAVHKKPTADHSYWQLKFNVGSASVIVQYALGEVNYEVTTGKITFNGSEIEIANLRARTRQAIMTDMYPGHAQSALDKYVEVDNDGTGINPDNVTLHHCNLLLGIRQICGHFEGFGLCPIGDILRINSRALNDKSLNPEMRLAPGLVFVASEWSQSADTVLDSALAAKGSDKESRPNDIDDGDPDLQFALALSMSNHTDFDPSLASNADDGEIRLDVIRGSENRNYLQVRLDGSDTD